MRHCNKSALCVPNLSSSSLSLSPSVPTFAADFFLCLSCFSPSFHYLFSISTAYIFQDRCNVRKLYFDPVDCINPGTVYISTLNISSELRIRVHAFCWIFGCVYMHLKANSLSNGLTSRVADFSSPMFIRQIMRMIDGNKKKKLD